MRPVPSLFEAGDSGSVMLDQPDVIDEEVLECIKNGITHRLLIALESRMHFHVVDQSLERLRLAGRIAYEGPNIGWKVLS